MLVVTPGRRAPAPLVVCRAVVSNAVTVALLVALASVAFAVLNDAPALLEVAPAAAAVLGLGFGMPLGLVHGVAQLVACGGAPPERPDAASRTAATAVAALPVAALTIASAASLDWLWAAGAALVQGAVAWHRAPRWVAWRGPHRSG